MKVKVKVNDAIQQKSKRHKIQLQTENISAEGKKVLHTVLYIRYGVLYEKWNGVGEEKANNYFRN